MFLYWAKICPSTPIFCYWFYFLVLLIQICIFSFKIVTLRDQTLMKLLGFPFGICLQNKIRPLPSPANLPHFVMALPPLWPHPQPISPTFLNSHNSRYPLTVFYWRMKICLPWGSAARGRRAGFWKAVCSEEAKSGLNHNTALGLSAHPWDTALKEVAFPCSTVSGYGQTMDLLGVRSRANTSSHYFQGVMSSAGFKTAHYDSSLEQVWLWGSQNLPHWVRVPRQSQESLVTQVPMRGGSRKGLPITCSRSRELVHRAMGKATLFR